MTLNDASIISVTKSILAEFLTLKMIITWGFLMSFHPDMQRKVCALVTPANSPHAVYQIWGESGKAGFTAISYINTLLCPGHCTRLGRQTVNWKAVVCPLRESIIYG